MFNFEAQIVIQFAFVAIFSGAHRKRVRCICDIPYLSIREKHQFVEHVEYFQSRLVDGQDNCTIRVRQLVQMRQKLH